MDVGKSVCWICELLLVSWVGSVTGCLHAEGCRYRELYDRHTCMVQSVSKIYRIDLLLTFVAVMLLNMRCSDYAPANKIQNIFSSWRYVFSFGLMSIGISLPLRAGNERPTMLQNLSE